MKLSHIVIAAASVVAAGVAAWGTALSFATTAEATVIARDPQLLSVVARDYSFEAPEKIGAGATTIRLVNHGPEMHHVQLIRLEGGRTVADLMEALKSNPHGPPAWVTWIGGPNVPAPGQSSSAIIDLTPGSYAFVCVIPSKDGVPHLMKGMIRPLTVTPAAGRPAPMPTADVKMDLVDYGFRLDKPLTAGKQLIKVTVDAPQAHEVLLAKLAPGKSAMDLLKWLEKEEGPPPGMPVGGTSVIAKGGTNLIPVDLTPGNYALICFAPDHKDGKPHFVHGMVREIVVK